MASTKKPTHFIRKIFLAVFLIVVFFWGYAVFYPRSLPAQTYQLIIAKQEPLYKVANRLAKDGVISSPRLLVWVSRLMERDKKITAGMYILKRPMSLVELIERISNGKPDEISITLLDGWTLRQIRAALDSESNITHLTAGLPESQIMAQLKLDSPRMEGLLYPSTYFIAPKQSDLEVLQAAAKLMQSKLTARWNSRNANTVYSSPYQLLTMASLIQKETNDKADMYQISTVFNNRIRQHMRLQDDPAVFYGLGNRATIIRADFQINTPYNTYLNDGLPPTPICTPSQAALDAAANPSSDYKLLYFIAIGNGKSKFSYNFQEHTAAVNKYLKKK